jgi:hypothetical protein
MALSKVILLVGAGATGTVVLRNTKVSEILNDVSQVHTHTHTHTHSLSLSLSVSDPRSLDRLYYSWPSSIKQGLWYWLFCDGFMVIRVSGPEFFLQSRGFCRAISIIMSSWSFSCSSSFESMLLV